MNATRLSAPDRREQILRVATEVFGAVGYAAGTTDAIAKKAGISQAYVVRTFGSKEQLLLEVSQRACARVETLFREAIAGFTDDETPHHKQAKMGAAYRKLTADRGLMLALMHTYTMGHDPVVGPHARDGFLRIYRIVRHEAELSRQDAMLFMAQGMLIDTLMAIRITESDDPAAAELAACALNVDAAGLHVWEEELAASRR